MNRCVAGAGPSGLCSRWEFHETNAPRVEAASPFFLKHGIILSSVSLTAFSLMLALGVNRSRTGSRRCRTRAGLPISAHAISVKSDRTAHSIPTPGTLLLSLRNDFYETPDRTLNFHKSCIPIADFACCRCCARCGDNIKVFSQLTNFKVVFFRQGSGCEVAAFQRPPRKSRIPSKGGHDTVNPSATTEGANGHNSKKNYSTAFPCLDSN